MFAAQLRGMAPLADTIDIVVADGGSTDGSLALDTLDDFRLRALLVKRGPGKLSAQMRMAIDFALGEGYEGLVVIDGNGKDDSRADSALHRAARRGLRSRAGVAIRSRRRGDQHAAQPDARRPAAARAADQRSRPACATPTRPTAFARTAGDCSPIRASSRCATCSSATSCTTIWRFARRASAFA